MNLKKTLVWKSVPLRLGSLVIVCLLASYFLIDWIAMPILTRHGRECTVPLIAGMSLEDAERVLRKGKLRLKVLAEESSNQKVAGTVLLQNPEAGKIVKRGRSIKVIVSKGGESVEVPNLAGVSLRQAELTLTQRMLEIGDINWALSDRLPENVVVSSIPSAGSLVPEGMSVNLLVSQGKLYDVVMMPKLVGKNLEQAQRIIDSLKLEIGRVKYRQRADLLPGMVIAQTPENGTKLEAGTKIGLEVSSTE